MLNPERRKLRQQKRSKKIGMLQTQNYMQRQKVNQK